MPRVDADPAVQPAALPSPLPGHLGCLGPVHGRLRWRHATKHLHGHDAGRVWWNRLPGIAQHATVQHACVPGVGLCRLLVAVWPVLRRVRRRHAVVDVHGGVARAKRWSSLPRQPQPDPGVQPAAVPGQLPGCVVGLGLLLRAVWRRLAITGLQRGRGRAEWRDCLPGLAADPSVQPAGLSARRLPGHVVGLERLHGDLRRRHAEPVLYRDATAGPWRCVVSVVAAKSAV